MDIRSALDVLRPNSKWRNGPITGNLSQDINAIKWGDQSFPMPTLAELEQALTDLQAEQTAADQARQQEEQAAKQARQNIQFLMSLMAADEQQIRQWVQSNGQETSIVRLTQVLQFVLRWIRSREKRLPELAEKE